MDNKNLFGDEGLLIQDVNEPELPMEEELRFRRPKKLIRRKRALLAVIVVLVLLFVGACSFAVYKIFFGGDKYDGSTAFYFTSDLLSETGGEYKAIGTIDFNLYNYADSLRTSREVIEDFDIQVKADGKTITNKVTVNTGEKVMDADIRSACSVSIAVPEKYHDQKIDVKVTSKPVEISLYATFDFEPMWGYEVKDDGIYTELILYANEDVTLELKWNEKKLIADPTNQYVEAANESKEECYVSLAGGMSTSIYFFKKDPEETFDKDSDVIEVSESEKFIMVEDEFASVYEEKEENKDEE